MNQNTCFGATDASINVIGVGGLGEYNYGLVDGDNNIIYPVRPEISNFQGLSPGTYKALVRDIRQGLLVRSDLITITEPEQLSVKIESSSASISNSNTGIVNLEVIGGTAPYEYSLNDTVLYLPLVDSKVSELSVGEHLVRIRDFNSCLLYTSPSPRDQRGSRMPSSA